MALGYVEASAKLGYDVSLPRSDVSAEKSDGVALAIIRAELKGRPLYFDTREIAGWDANRLHLNGNRNRAHHISRAVSQLNGLVDVILVDKSPAGKSTSAEPWTRGNSFWSVTYFDSTTGHHRVELVAT